MSARTLLRHLEGRRQRVHLSVSPTLPTLLCRASLPLGREARLASHSARLASSPTLLLAGVRPPLAGHAGGQTRRTEALWPPWLSLGAPTLPQSGAGGGGGPWRHRKKRPRIFRGAGLVTCSRRELLCSDTVRRSSLRGSRDTPSRRGGDQRGHLARPPPSGRTDGYRSQL